MIKVIKRDGRLFDFQPSRIQQAVASAEKSIGVYTDDKLSLEIARDIVNLVEDNTEVEIDLIVSHVERMLMERAPDVARAYIEYRQTRDIRRSEKSNIVKSIQGILHQSDEAALLENANKDSAIIPTMRDMVAGAASKEIAKLILPEHIIKAHEIGDIHYHDLDYAPAFPMVNCCLVDLKRMLKNGFKMGNAEIESPKSITTATAVTAQIIAQVASHIYGGTSIDNIDIVLAPYVKESHKKHFEIGVAAFTKAKVPTHLVKEYAKKYADERTEKECYDAFQSLEYEINTLHTANGQTPFVTLAFGRGKSKESKLIQESILKNRIKGLGKHGKTPTFPKLTFYKENGVNNRPEDINYSVKQLAIRCSAKRLYPDYLSVEALRKATGSVKAPMGCRSFLGTWHDAGGNEVHDGRNNLGVVSVNLPRIALESKDEDDFFSRLDERLETCREALMTRIDRLRGVKAKVAPVLYCEGAFGVNLDPEDEIMPIFENGRASISLGYIGIHETVKALTGNNPFDNGHAKLLGLDIVKYMRGRVDEWKEETGFGFSLYSTPSENLCDRFCRLDQKKFGIIEGVTDRDYYTNSFHLDVRVKTDPYSKFDFEQVYNFIANGGFINYVELPNLLHNLKAIENILDYAHENNPYVGINVPSDHCYVCDFEGETTPTSKGFVCPKCGNRDYSKMSVVRRVCGYLAAEKGVNHGKMQEMKGRVKHV